jgi:outer membrane protein assembly factor BamB
VWARRGFLAVVLVGAALVPGRAASVTAARCAGQHCARHPGKIRWTRRLPGSWTTQGGALGTVLSRGQAYAAVGGGVVAVGFGSTVTAYRLTNGQPLWTTGLVGFQAGSAIVSVRAWTGVLTVGVSSPAVQGRAGRRREVVLSAATGQHIQTYPAAAYGGAVLADETRTVIVGTGAVTSYANASGKAVWRRPTGAVAQAWRAAGGELFVTIAKGGYLGASPVTAVRRIDLSSGRQQILRPPGGSFAGALSSATGGAVLFSGSAGLTAYSGIDGRLLWQSTGVPEVADTARQTLYVASGNALIGLNPATGKVVTRSATPGAAGLYAVNDGVALGLDEGALGDAWGYDLARRRVIWTARAVPWPHFFVDLSGIGGSVGPSGSTVVLASCAQVGVAQVSGSAPPCLRPELVALGP